MDNVTKYNTLKLKVEDKQIILAWPVIWGEWNDKKLNYWKSLAPQCKEFHIFKHKKEALDAYDALSTL